MRLFLKNFFNSKLFISIRNTLNKFEVQQDISDKYNFTISDSFLWRTDDNFETKFIFSDILKLFYEQKDKDTYAEIQIFSHKNKLLKKLNLKKLKLFNELIITKRFLDGYEGYGSFYIFHHSSDFIKEKPVISNRCYTGFKKDNLSFSFLHGNALSRGTSINKNDKFNFEIIKKSLIKNQIYKIQKNFRKFDFSELFFINPFEKKIEFNLNSEKVYLNPGFTKKIIIKDQDIVELESNIMFFRPTIFSHRNNFIDVHHS